MKHHSSQQQQYIEINGRKTVHEEIESRLVVSQGKRMLVKSGFSNVESQEIPKWS